MSVQELESAVSRLSKEELALFSRWFEEYTADPERSEWATLGGRNIARESGSVLSNCAFFSARESGSVLSNCALFSGNRESVIGIRGQSGSALPIVN